MKLRIGSRGSALAVTQTTWVASEIKKKNPDVEISLHQITTTGDKNLSASFQQAGGKGIFVKEIEEALLSNQIDLAVHSLKDMPQELPVGLVLGPSPEREDCRDALISRFGEQLQELPRGSIVGTSSPRRRAQILYKFRRRQYQLEPLRGNVDTRIKKLEEGQYAAIVLAVAGLKRLGLEKDISQIIEPDLMLPAPCQGALGLEYRESDSVTAALVESIQNLEATATSIAERAFLMGLGGNCSVPVGAYSFIKEGKLFMKSVLLDPDGNTAVFAEQDGVFDQPDFVGALLAERLLYNGGSELLMDGIDAHG